MCACGRRPRPPRKLAHRLVGHPAIARVLYPGLEDHPGHEVALRQMTGGFGGMLSIRIKDGEKAAIAVAARVELWKRATSLGGVESLIEHRASIEGEGSPCPGDLLRFSVGLEDPDELYFDLARALGRGAIGIIDANRCRCDHLQDPDARASRRPGCRRRCGRKNARRSRACFIRDLSQHHPVAGR